MAEFNTNDILTGASGRVWMNGKLLATVSKFEAKISGNFEDIEICGDVATYQMYTGWSGSGTITMKKIDSTVTDMMIDAYNSGVMPDIQIFSELKNSRTKQAARYQIGIVTIPEAVVASFEAKKPVEEEISFNFSSIRRLSGIGG